MSQFVVAVDFDGTIHNAEDREPGYKMGKPFPGAKQTLDMLKQIGATVVIHTCRARAAHGEPDPDFENPRHAYVSTVGYVADWLDYFEIPYDEITALKPIADVYLDDKAIPFQGDWDATQMELLSLFYLGERM